MEASKTDMDSRFVRKVFMNKKDKLRALTMKDTSERKDTSVGDLSKKTKPELLDLLERQNKLLANKKFIDRLPDRGEKLKSLKERIEKALEDKKEFSDLSELFTKLNLNHASKIDVESLEWKNLENGYDTINGDREIELYSDDEMPEDPLEVLATPQYGGHRVKHKTVEKPLVTAQDVKEAKEFQPKMDFLTEMATKLDKVPVKGRLFLPWRSLKSAEEDSSREQRAKPSWWEVTAATPPDNIYGKVSPMPLVEAMKLEREQDEKRKEIEMHESVVRLSQQPGISFMGSGGSYREVHEASESEDEEFT